MKLCKYENVQKGKCADIKCANRKMCQYEDVQTGKCANMYNRLSGIF